MILLFRLTTFSFVDGHSSFVFFVNLVAHRPLLHQLALGSVVPSQPLLGTIHLRLAGHLLVRLNLLGEVGALPDQGAP